MGEQRGTFPNHLGVQDRWLGVCCQVQYAPDGEGGQTRLRMKRDAIPKVDRPKSTYVKRWKPHEHLDICVYCGKAWACK